MPARLRYIGLWVIAFSAFLPRCNAQSGRATSVESNITAPTRLVVLGVSHSAQLVARSYQPAMFRAFFDKLKPAAICIERDPDNYARHNFYEFTYEQQNIVMPWAAQMHTPVFPVDWVPPAEDQLLAWNIADIESPGFVRNPSGFHGFVTFDDPTDLGLDLFFAETGSARKEADSWYDSARAAGAQDFSRRLELYRTFMQAMRIRNVTKTLRGQTVLVIVGQMHKYDIEHVLADEQGIEIVQPSTFGAPSPTDIEKELTLPDLFAIASFNLLGAQPLTRNTSWEWVNEVLTMLERRAPGLEAGVLRTRYKVLRGLLTPQAAIGAYSKLLQDVENDREFTYTGVVDQRRVDSFFDPFGNLSIRQRLMLELARENGKAHQPEQAESWKNKLFLSGLTEMKKAQTQSYWQRYVDEAL